MSKGASGSKRQRRGVAGYSMLELGVSLAILAILTAIALPTLMQSLRSYQLNDAATRVTDQLKYTRFDAVRRNTQISFLMEGSGTSWLIGTDSNKNGSIDATEKQQALAGFATLLPSGVAPAPNAISTALGGATLTTMSGSAGSVTFDARGAVRVGGLVSTNVDIFYIGSTTDPEYGYRAVVLLPSGATQIWSAQAGGIWQKIG